LTLPLGNCAARDVTRGTCKRSEIYKRIWTTTNRKLSIDEIEVLERATRIEQHDRMIVPDQPIGDETFDGRE
jgi:hypothetical protein